MSRELTNAEVKVLTELSYKKSIEKGTKMNKELTKEQLIKRLAKLKPSNYLYWYAGKEFHAIYEYDKETDIFIGWGEQEEPLTFKYESLPTHLLKRRH